MIDISTTFVVVIFRVKVSCIISVDSIIKTLVINLFGQLRHNVIGCPSVCRNIRHYQQQSYSGLCSLGYDHGQPFYEITLGFKPFTLEK